MKLKRMSPINEAVQNYTGKKKLKESLEEANLREADERINLKRYGFVRAPQEDFTDDGNRFFCYYYDPQREGDTRFRLSKLVADGDAYISVHYTAPGSNRSKYFDDLNGVPVSAAVAGLPKLVQDIENFKGQIDEFSKVVDIPEDKKDEIFAKAKAYLSEHPDSGSYGAVTTSLKGVLSNDDYERLDKSKVRELIREFTDTQREVDPEKVRQIAAEYIREVMRKMQSGYDSRRNWISGKSLEDAIKYAYLPSDLPTSVQEKIKDWVRKKLDRNDFTL